MEMPMTESVMNQIDKWAKKKHIQNGLTFLNRKGKESNLMMVMIRLHWLCDLRLPLFLTYLLKLQEYSLSMVCSPS